MDAATGLDMMNPALEPLSDEPIEGAQRRKVGKLVEISDVEQSGGQKCGCCDDSEGESGRLSTAKIERPVNSSRAVGIESPDIKRFADRACSTDCPGDDRAE